MKLVLVILLIFSFIAVGVFGFIAMNSNHGQADEALCLATIAKFAGCLKEDNNLSLASFHIGVFKSFSNAVLAMALGILFGVVLIWARWPRFMEPVPEPKVQRLTNFAQFAPLYQRQLINWIETLGKRDPEAR